MPILGPIDPRTFYGLKIGPLLTEIQPLLCRKYRTQFFLNINFKIKVVFFLNFFLSLPTDWEFLVYEKKFRWQNFI